jgi:hypothetical protein
MQQVIGAGVAAGDLPPELRTIVDAGFTTDRNAVLLTGLIPLATNARPSSFPDATGYEAFINSLHIADYETGGSPVSTALALVRAMFRRWNEARPSERLVAVISRSDPGDAVVRFHVSRPLERWLADDLEGYDEPVLEMMSEDQTVPDFSPWIADGVPRGPDVDIVRAGGAADGSLAIHLVDRGNPASACELSFEVPLATYMTDAGNLDAYWKIGLSTDVATVYMATQSPFLDWFDSASQGIYRSAKLRHFAVLTNDQCIEVITIADPVIANGQGEVPLSLSLEELRIVVAALNEVCNGIDIAEFEFATRMGYSREIVRTLMRRLIAAYDRATGGSAR